MKNLRLKSAIALSFALSACSLAPQYQRPEIAMPAGWTNVAGVGVSDQPAITPFWQELGSDELNNVMKVALAQNLDLEAALHRIDQARAQSQNCRLLTLSADRSQWRRIAQFSRPAERQHGTWHRQH